MPLTIGALTTGALTTGALLAIGAMLMLSETEGERKSAKNLQKSRRRVRFAHGVADRG